MQVPPFDPTTLSVLWDIEAGDPNGLLTYTGYITRVTINDFVRQREVLFPTPVTEFAALFRETITFTPGTVGAYRTA
ncbi:MAG TPA: hypothetical protein VEX68_29225 [Bryobacteraceae bacterium]|nr:hypothetical protein [Bryobacteraceae bacterium]